MKCHLENFKVTKDLSYKGRQSFNFTMVFKTDFKLNNQIEQDQKKIFGQK